MMLISVPFSSRCLAKLRQMLDTDHFTTAVDVADLQPDSLRGLKTCCVGRRQGRTGVQARHAPRKAAPRRCSTPLAACMASEHRRSASEFGHGPAPRRRRTLARTPSGLRWPRDSDRDQMNVDGAGVLQTESGPANGPSGAKSLAMHVGSHAWSARVYGAISSIMRRQSGLTRPFYYPCCQDCASTAAILQSSKTEASPAKRRGAVQSGLQ